ncbi:MAG: hypothetical protein IT525_08875 [Nitrosomonas sp.]|nr:hypothetical protein [Nitrosomonas sp.]
MINRKIIASKNTANSGVGRIRSDSDNPPSDIPATQHQKHKKTARPRRVRAVGLFANVVRQRHGGLPDDESALRGFTCGAMPVGYCALRGLMINRKIIASKNTANSGVGRIRSDSDNPPWDRYPPPRINKAIKKTAQPGRDERFVVVSPVSWRIA